MKRLLLMASLAVLAGPAQAQTSWSALAADRSATAVGDTLTVIVVETNSATAAAQSANRRDTRLSGAVRSGSGDGRSGGLEFSGGASGQGQMSRSGRLLAQISVTVQAVHPNGDLSVSGAQMIDLDGEKTAIRLNARVRRADISGDNTVLSSRLADAEIGYDADGSLSRSGRPGPITRLLSFMGLS